MVEQHPLFEEAATETLPTRALTLWQPWAWLVVHGHKPIENRPPGFSHKSFRGWFWIHAGGRWKYEEWEFCSETCKQCGFGGLPAFASYENYPLGAIIGKARITGIVEPAPPAPVPWHFPGQYGFVIEEATPLENPVPCRGYQGFWKVPTAALEKLREAT
jgi:hypothetical protein